ncbi:DMT family transporter [Acidianus ambivalens]|uniref:EamA family transporter n=1 Tax=Acidianus ambivalens TaxID=2283 RepID=A0A650CUJ0_ACIAM|nr:EamA family transporter [Acidianus ambivalens]MQL55980.1 EamA family transporter [Acidianus ambivalens]QGR21463.1 EamA family transporter [Acidianus ambivalens]
MRTSGHVDLTLAAFFWGTIGIAVNYFYLLGGSPFTMVIMRSIFSTIVSLFIVKKIVVNKYAIGMGFVSSLFYLTYIYTIPIDGPSLSAVLLYTAPLWVSIFSYFLVKEKATLGKIVSSLMILVGLYIMYLGVPTFQQFLLGLASGLTYAGLISFSRLLQRKGMSDWEIIFSQSLWSIPFSLPFVRVLNLPSVYAGIYLAIFASVIPYFFFYRGMKKTDSITASIITALEPIFTIILSMIIFREFLNIYETIGTIIILLAIFLSVKMH